jgi:hypothetical protein
MNKASNHLKKAHNHLYKYTSNAEDQQESLIILTTMVFRDMRDAWERNSAITGNQKITDVQLKEDLVKLGEVMI